MTPRSLQRMVFKTSLAALLFCAASLFAQTPSFITFDAPDAGTTDNHGTIPHYINSKGVIAGDYLDDNDAFHCFIRDVKGVITEFDPPGMNVPHVSGINSRGQIIGTGVAAFGFQGFLRTISGQFFHIHVPGAISTQAVAINDKGQIAGSYDDAAQVTHGFFRNADGTYTLFDDPDASQALVQGTSPRAINDNGEIAGVYNDKNTGGVRAFVRDHFGNFTNFDPTPGLPLIDSIALNLSGEIVGRYVVPNGSFGFIRQTSGSLVDFGVPNADGETFPTAINDAGVIVGQWYDTQFVSHGFIRNGSGNIAVFSVPVTNNGTFPYSINNTGRITGYYPDARFVYRGFVR
jgi:uncharacterized membrane protein